ncbi:predicted protein [Naegleria gruberi]|uniref:Predicted protein n=1 Tax=Naegleria gruberi TaxID=5762 RepID=D2W2N0_NAEGR|nr:uncharacterized protein NAEGRDRAFT_75647 [Naegleria gruberi]EFC36643.1 predicted protein [Naegleria gruberi]|eukprot:XP_002669387.1 predicted protein [Naegleria gruberi strain NEG-M]
MRRNQEDSDVELSVRSEVSSVTSLGTAMIAEEQEESRKECKRKSIFLCIFTAFFLMLVIPQLSLFIYFYLTVDSDPSLANDPNALVFRHSNCCTIENSFVDCFTSLKDTFCSFNITFPVQGFDEDSDPDAINDCVIAPNTTFRTRTDSITYKMNVGSEDYIKYATNMQNRTKIENISCYTDRTESYVSVNSISRLYNSYYFAMIAMGILMSGFCLAIIIGWMVIPFINLKRDGPRRRKRNRQAAANIINTANR